MAEETAFEREIVGLVQQDHLGVGDERAVNVPSELPCGGQFALAQVEAFSRGERRDAVK